MRALLFAGLLAWLAGGGQGARRFDVAIVEGHVVDGSGGPPRRADVGIAGGRITAIRSSGRMEAHEVIDARGLVVAPGFVDVHTHADNLTAYPRAEHFVRMGVTTIVAGNCGSSAVDVAGLLADVSRAGASVNFATLIGHNAVRSEVMGAGDRVPSIGEMARMRSLVWRAMADGALGFSTGLQYVPGIYASPAEIVELARIAANAGGVYASHLRNEGTHLEAGLEEALRVATTTRGRVQISHLKVDSPSRWGASEQALALIDAARARGLQVMADQYPYTAAASTLSIRFPSWALEGGRDATAVRLTDPAQWLKARAEMRAMLAARGFDDLAFATVASYAPDDSLQGLTMKQVALKTRGADDVEAQLDVARDMQLAGGAGMVYHLMSDADVERIMRHPFVAFASDGGLVPFGEGQPHPRTYGNAARVLAEYVRGRRVITLQEAIRKMTSLPAGHFRLSDRGLLREGRPADVVVFDPKTVRDAATFERPHAYAEGLPYVLVNGIVTVRDGQHTGAREGRVLSREIPDPRSLIPNP